MLLCGIAKCNHHWNQKKSHPSVSFIMGKWKKQEAEVDAAKDGGRRMKKKCQ